MFFDGEIRLSLVNIVSPTPKPLNRESLRCICSVRTGRLQGPGSNTHNNSSETAQLSGATGSGVVRSRSRGGRG